MKLTLTGMLYCYMTRKEMEQVYDRLKELSIPDVFLDKAYNPIGVPYPWTIALICHSFEKFKELDDYLVDQKIDLGDADIYVGEPRIKEFFGMWHLGKHDPGILRIKEGTCPLNATNPIACMFCQFGHMLECHYPENCEESQCSHLEQYE